MITRDLIATYALPILGAILLGIVQRWAASSQRANDAATRSNDTAARSQRVASLAHYVEAAVAFVQSTFVAALKDPSKPGTWTEVTSATARDLAIRAVRETAPKLIDELEKDGGDLDKLFAGFVESAVLKQKASASVPARVVAPASATPAVDVAVAAPVSAAPAAVSAPEPTDVATDSHGA